MLPIDATHHTPHHATSAVIVDVTSRLSQTIVVLLLLVGLLLMIQYHALVHMLFPDSLLYMPMQCSCTGSSLSVKWSEKIWGEQGKLSPLLHGNSSGLP